MPYGGDEGLDRDETSSSTPELEQQQELDPEPNQQPELDPKLE